MSGTVALSIPGLLLTCVQYVVVIRLGRNFEKDFGSCNLELRWIELRMRRWGAAVGITDEGSDNFLKEFAKIHDESQAELVSDTLDQIATQLGRAKEDSEKILKKKRNPAELVLIEEVEGLSISEPKVALANRVVNKLKTTYDKRLQAGSKFVAKSEWALYRKTELENLVKFLREHVTQLEAYIPGQEHRLAVAEAKEMAKEEFEALSEVVDASDPLLADAMKQEAPKSGFSFHNVTATGYSSLRVGHLFRESRPYDVGHTAYRNLNAHDHSVVHTGNVYGYEEIPVMQSAYGSRPPSSTMPGAIDRNTFVRGPFFDDP